MSSHDKRRPCPVPGCKQFIKPSHALCASHWNVVPGKIKQQVNREYREHPGSQDHLLAIAAACEAVEAVSHRGRPV